METTYNKLNNFNSNLFEKLKEYLDTPIYFYGSIQRWDFFPDYSDIDIDIFTDNTESTLNKLTNFLNIDKRTIEPVIFRTRTRDLIKGYKLSYENIRDKLRLEISVYNEKDKEIILTEHKRSIDLPIIVGLILIIIKFVYYKLKLIDKDLFNYLKNKTIHMFDNTIPIFVTIPHKVTVPKY